ncbi:MAG: hypothetical protein JRI86_03765 [Deltaproteobacteria bacterium]|nr:hypothetical protein [Deltaproteobacteria bacterium]
MKKILSALTGVIFIAIIAGSAYGYHSHVGQTEVLYLNKDKAYAGYNLFRSYMAKGGMTTFLLDIEGHVINTWPSYGMPRFLDNGNIFDTGPVGGQKPGLIEMDWDGNTVWKWNVPESRTDLTGRKALHHQTQRIFNKALNAYTSIVIMSKTLSHEEAIALGADPAKAISGCAPDGILEVDMDGNIIWEWWTMDHVIQDLFPDKPNYVGKGKKISDYPGRLDMNWGRGLRGDFVHFNSLDYNPTLGHIAANNSFGSEFLVIDHDGTFVPNDYEASKKKAAGAEGDMIFRWGNPGRYGAGEEPSWEYGTSSLGDQQCFFTHSITWIKEGLPGAGNFMYFDNNSLRPGTTFSRVLEINPYDGPMKDGKYVPLMEGGFNYNHVSNQIVWSYQSVDYTSFYSDYGSSANRLPNGNTYVTASGGGQMFQITPNGELAWEYINPCTTEGIKKIIIDPPPRDYNASGFSWMYSPDHPALKGRNLTPKGTITELAAQGEFGGLTETTAKPPSERASKRGGKNRGKGKGKGGGKK